MTSLPQISHSLRRENNEFRARLTKSSMARDSAVLPLAEFMEWFAERQNVTRRGQPDSLRGAGRLVLRAGQRQPRPPQRAVLLGRGLRVRPAPIRRRAGRSRSSTSPRSASSASSSRRSTASCTASCRPRWSRETSTPCSCRRPYRPRAATTPASTTARACPTWSTSGAIRGRRSRRRPAVRAGLLVLPQTQPQHGRRGDRGRRGARRVLLADHRPAAASCCTWTTWSTWTPGPCWRACRSTVRSRLADGRCATARRFRGALPARWSRTGTPCAPPRTC